MSLNLTLRILVTAAWPAEEAACEWALLNAQGLPLQRGKSEPRHWPMADHCEVVLSAEQCLVLKAQLPKGARARPSEVIAYALEEQLINDADHEHFVLGDTADGSHTAVNKALPSTCPTTVSPPSNSAWPCTPPGKTTRPLWASTSIARAAKAARSTPKP
ncbi:MAG: type II secretion system protein GspL [Proteobacteria bacterium]|nr:type II secretion system protein GspL [Pseudomonadota bacterium]